MKTRKIRYLLLILLFSVTIYGQINQTLSQQLWKQVQSCHNSLEDVDDDGKIDYDEIIDDSKNGYLKIAGGWPTCGCSCESIAGAYRKKSGQYLFIQKSYWECSWKREFSSSDQFTTIFPFDLEKDGFFSQDIESFNQTATFYVDLEIPRKGTDTKVFLKTIPFGLDIKNKGNIVFGYSEESHTSNYNQLYQISKIVREIKNPKTLQYILKNQFDNISESDAALVYETIDKTDQGFKNKMELVSMLQELKQKYDLFTKIKHQWLLLGWDRTTGAFYIKEKGNRPEAVTFREFLMNNQFWSPMC
ncbi:hypothetical protein [Aquimarina algicola]|uniref:EF-hand domain-containing protein n=1 Tax=Aquimarina algicola TaxID=2589995 RepID=A0A504J9L2_9FLAO|nr:hypothetical protein [Aquimarina algicola]TPN82871.1 hypothetical protein FHK87_20815 [Aquimarina algicola]